MEIESAVIHGLSSSYAGGEDPAMSLPKGLLAIVGGSGYLEVAAKNGSAAQQLGSAVGSRVSVIRSTAV